MLSVQPLKSAQGAVDYYTKAYNYYAGDAQAMRWLGRGAEMLGLGKEIEKEQYMYHLLTDTSFFVVNNIRVGDYNSGIDKYLRK